MNITHFKMSGWDSAIRCMFMTKKTYDQALEDRLQEAEKAIHQGSAGCSIRNEDEELIKWYNEQKSLVIKIGKVHYNLLKHVDFTATVVGLHRGAQDDFDSHAERFDTRIIRMSTREKNNKSLTEVSDYYKGKIMTFDDLVNKFSLPEGVTYRGQIYVRTPLGYIREDCLDDKDVRRGLIPLAISSDFTFKCDIAEFCHVFRERNSAGNAHPELQELVEMLVKKINREEKELDREFFINSCIQ